MTNYEIDILKKALLKVERKELNRFRNLPNQEVEFSEEFENSIQKLAKKRKTFFWQATKTVPRRIIVVFVAAIITFCMMMSISAIRTPVVNFFINVYEDFISIFVEDENSNTPDTIEKVYLPSYMINNYSQVSSQNYGNRVDTIWNYERHNIFLSQSILKEDFKSYIDNQNIDYIKTSFATTDVHYMSKNGQYLIIWSKDYYLFSIICPDEIEFDEIEHIIESLNTSNNQ